MHTNKNSSPMQAMTESVNCLSEEVSRLSTKRTTHSTMTRVANNTRSRPPPHVSSQISTLTQKFKDEVQAYKSNQGY